MPVKIPDKLPATEILTNENVFVMTETRAVHQDIRPLENPYSQFNAPEDQYGGASPEDYWRTVPLQVEVDLMQPVTHTSRNTPQEHLKVFYKTFKDVKS